MIQELIQELVERDETCHTADVELARPRRRPPSPTRDSELFYLPRQSKVCRSATPRCPEKVSEVRSQIFVVEQAIIIIIIIIITTITITIPSETGI